VYFLNVLLFQIKVNFARREREKRLYSEVLTADEVVDEVAVLSV